MNIVIAPEYESLRGLIERAPAITDSNNCKVLYNERNKVVELEPYEGHTLVVKRYKRHDWFKSIVYTLFRPNKALRSFKHARELRRRGFATPHEVAYIEERKCGFITQVYYICAYTDKEPIRTELVYKTEFNRELATAYAHYAVSLHKAGILHRDLNCSNVLYEKTATGYTFEVIDINRMNLYDGEVPKAECMENITLFSDFNDTFKYVLQAYAKARGWTQSDIDEAIRVKIRHDRNRARRKRFTGFLKKYILGK